MKRESVLLGEIYSRSAGMGSRFPAVVVGPGDDCAVVRIASAMRTVDALWTVDQVVEGRHFRKGEDVALVGRKAVARSVSDIAAMGGRPVAATATGALPDDFAQESELFAAMKEFAEEWGCPLVGGDIARCEGAMVLTVSVLGVSHETRGPVLRDGARVGDGVYVTGEVGGSFASGKHLRFEPRVGEGTLLCDALGERLHAMIDVSDGVGRDAGRIALASGVGMEIEVGALPLAEGLGAGDWKRGLSEGEDYELLFTVAESACESVANEIEVSGRDGVTRRVRVTRIGRMVEGSGCVGVLNDGTRVDAAELGWDHGA